MFSYHLLVPVLRLQAIMPAGHVAGKLQFPIVLSCQLSTPFRGPASKASKFLRSCLSHAHVFRLSQSHSFADFTGSLPLPQQTDRTPTT